MPATRSLTLPSGLGLGTHPAAVRARVEALEHLLEGLFVIPGTSQRVGLDAIIDLLPVAGSVVGG